MSSVYVSNLIINTGATFSQSFDLLDSESSGPLNLNGFTVASQFRKHAGSSTKTDFTTAITDATNGQISISLTSTQTAAISKPGRYVYDVVIDNGSSVKTRVIEGSVLVREGVTK